MIDKTDKASYERRRENEANRLHRESENIKNRNHREKLGNIRNEQAFNRDQMRINAKQTESRLKREQQLEDRHTDVVLNHEAAIINTRAQMEIAQINARTEVYKVKAERQLFERKHELQPEVDDREIKKEASLADLRIQEKVYDAHIDDWSKKRQLFYDLIQSRYKNEFDKDNFAFKQRYLLEMRILARNTGLDSNEIDQEEVVNFIREYERQNDK